jgi:hypothetical protein
MIAHVMTMMTIMKVLEAQMTTMCLLDVEIVCLTGQRVFSLLVVVDRTNMQMDGLVLSIQ